MLNLLLGFIIGVGVGVVYKDKIVAEYNRAVDKIKQFLKM